MNETYRKRSATSPGLVLVVSISLLAVFHVAAQEITTTDEATLMANEYVFGMNQRETGTYVAKSSTLMEIAGDSTPFINTIIAGAQAWRVTVGLSPDSASGAELFREFDVFLDANSGKFLKAECVFKPLAEVEVGILDVADAERQLKGSGEEYVGIPDSVPKVTMLDALLACPRSYLTAKLAEIRLLLISYDEKEPRPYWVITLRGIPPIRKREHVPINQTNHIRQIVDAETGRIIFATTDPQYKIDVNSPPDSSELR